MKKSKFIKSADETTKKEDENQFEIDESVIDEVSNAEEFADVEISNDDVMEAVAAIEALADAVMDKANVEEKKVDADELLDEVRDLIDGGADEEKLEEGEELPDEFIDSAVRVMVSEDGSTVLEQTPDEIYDSTIDDLECTMFDTCSDYIDDVEDTAEEPSDELLVIGNSRTKNYKKGYMKIKSSVSKKAWSAAVKKVKKLIGNNKEFTLSHWAIVSALAKKEEAHANLLKRIECKLIKIIRSNAELKAKLIKSSDEFDSAGQPVNETKPEEVAGKDNPGYKEEGDPTKEKSPEFVDSKSGDPKENNTEVDEEDEVILPETDVVYIEAPIKNSRQRVGLRRIITNSIKKYNVYKVIKSSSFANVLDGQVIKCGKIAYAFKLTNLGGLLACAAKYVDNGKGTYKPVLIENRVVITKGTEAPVFNNAERRIVADKIASAREAGRLEAQKAEIVAAKKNPTREPINSAVRPNPRKVVENKVPEKKSLNSTLSNKERLARLEAIKSRADARRQVNSAKNHELELRKMYDQEERQRLFQNSQKEINEEKTIIKNNNTRNSETLEKLYNSMF